jgi:hypothetical protein
MSFDIVNLELLVILKNHANLGFLLFIADIF